MTKELLKYCILYSGEEKQIENYPINNKCFIWTVEWVICNRKYDKYNYYTDEDWEDIFK